MHVSAVFGTMLHLLESLGLTINETKSKALLHWTGRQVRIIKSHILTRKGHQTCLIIPKPDGTSYHLPLVKSTLYLGVQLTYGCSAAETMTTRIQAARTAFVRLKRWLTGRRGLSLKWRLKLWKQSAWSILSYGLLATGITASSQHQLTVAVTQMIRQIAQNPAHITHHTNSQVFQALDLSSLSCMLLDLALARKEATHARLAVISSNDHLHTLNHPTLDQLINHLSRAQPAAPLPGSSTATVITEAHQCPLCDYTTTDLPTLKRHCTVHHKLTQFSLNHIDIYQDSVGGYPNAPSASRHLFTGVLFESTSANAPVRHRVWQTSVDFDDRTEIPSPSACFQDCALSISAS